MPKEKLVIRTSLGNKRVVLRENTSNYPIEASSSRPPPGGVSQSRRRKKGNTKRGFDEANKQINISHEGGVLKASFQADVSEALQVSHDGGVLKAHTTNDLVFTPQEKEMFFYADGQVQPRISVFQRLGKINEPKQKNVRVRNQKKWKLKKKKQQPRSFVWIRGQNDVSQIE